jgi:hypothetical protein
MIHWMHNIGSVLVLMVVGVLVICLIAVTLPLQYAWDCYANRDRP